MTTAQEAPSMIPDFGDEDTDRKICFIASKGTLDMVYPSLVMANAALGEGIETHIFFTFWGMDMINKGTMHDLQFTMLGNTAMHMKGSTKHLPQGLGGLPGMTGYATKMLKSQIAGMNVPEVPEFLDQLVDMGVQLWACKMSVDMMDLEKDDLYDGVADIINVDTFIEISDGAQVLFI